MSNSVLQRLPHPYGSMIDRSQVIEFEFDHQKYQGFAGDSIASALIANQRWVMSRSFKYHRPRAPLTMAGQDANTLIQLPEEANVLADTTDIQPRLRAAGQNFSGSLSETILLIEYLPINPASCPDEDFSARLYPIPRTAALESFLPGPE